MALQGVDHWIRDLTVGGYRKRFQESIVAIPRAGLEALLSKQAPLVKTLIQILVDNLRNVHQIYIKRPRSVIDFFNAIVYSVYKRLIQR